VTGEYFPPSLGSGYGKVWTIGQDTIPSTLYLEAGTDNTLGLSLVFGRDSDFVQFANLVPAIDLVVAGVGEDAEEQPGAFIPYDASDPASVAGSISVGAVVSGDPAGTMTWQIPPHLSIRWETSGNVWEEVQSGIAYPFAAGQSRALTVTGDSEGADHLQTRFSRLSAHRTDRAKISVSRWTLDLDIDSNNDGTIDGADDPVEDIAGDDTRPGKVILVSNFDSDDDGLVDWADGFDWRSGVTADDASPSTVFTPIKVTLPSDLD
jgi:hypothetical protein